MGLYLLSNFESIVNYLSKQKTSGPGEFTGEFYKIFKLESVSIFNNLFQR